ncbi:MAG: hypothetical protein U0Q55_18060 [Vicinamibacterales bacterium]
MTGPEPRRTNRSRGLLLLATAATATLLACGPVSYEIPIETPIQPKLDVTPFQRILIAGFVTGGTEDVDTNQETVRLLRSQLRAKSGLRIIDADVMPLVEIAQEQNRSSAEPPTQEVAAAPQEKPAQGTALPPRIREEKDLEPYERLFANTTYWKRIGEEYQNPLIVTGTVLFTPQSRSGFVSRDVEQYDSFGRRQVIPTRTYMERKGFMLRPKFIFIDGRSGATMYSESYREEVLYNVQQSTPALSSYFELMDRLVPNFLSTLSSQKVRGTRVLLK